MGIFDDLGVHVPGLSDREAEEFTGDYRILTGHRDETTLEYERERNPYIKKG